MKDIKRQEEEGLHIGMNEEQVVTSNEMTASLNHNKNYLNSPSQEEASPVIPSQSSQMGNVR